MALSDKMANDFEEEFVADVSEGDEDKVINTATVPLQLAYGIEAKGQLFSKCLFDILNSCKIERPYSKCFRSFFGRINFTKRAF